MPREMIDYKALAGRINEYLRRLEALNVAIEPSTFLDDLRTVVSLLEGMAEEKPAMWAQSNHVSWAGTQPFMVRCAPSQLHPDFVPLFTHPAPQPQQVEIAVHAGVGYWRAALCVGAQAFGFDAEFSTLEAAHAYADRIRTAIGSAPQPQPEPVSDLAPDPYPDEPEWEAPVEPTEAQIEARDALLDFISENGTASEGVQHYLDRYVRAALAAEESK